MIDLHCHLLPGVDDGARDLEDSLSMCRAAADDGCTDLVATPHLRHQRWWNDRPDRLHRLFQELQCVINAQPGLDIRIHLGGEVAINSESVRELDELPHCGLFSLAGSRYVLLEFDQRGFGPDPLEVVYETSVAGFFPIIAHPERIPFLADDHGLLDEMIRQGGLCQLTAMSLTGEFGKKIKRTSLTLLDQGLVHFVASDAHGVRLRVPGLGSAYRVVRSSWGDVAAATLFRSNPQSVLDDLALRSLVAAPVNQVGP